MLGEILIGILISGLIVYLMYCYLSWCSTYSDIKLLYEINPVFVSKKDRDLMDTYKKFMLPEYLSDTYKPIRFWLLYYQAYYDL
jgi:hypothetical protein